MKKTFEYAVGDSWLLDMKGEKSIYTVKDCKFRAEDGKEIYTVDVNGQITRVVTKNKLHFLLFRYMFKKLKSGKYRKYDCSLQEKDVLAYYANFRKKEEMRVERVAVLLERSAEYRDAVQEISLFSMLLAKAEYMRDDAFEFVRLKEKLEKAKEKRRAVFAKLGIKPGEEKKRIYCAKCQDTGILPSGRICSCAEARENEIRAYVAEVEQCKPKV